jgi:RimJ/RimL family protein N-acetyltransferase
VIAAGPVTLRPWQPSDASFVYFSCQDEEIRRWTRYEAPFRAGAAAAFVSRHARPQPEEVGAFFAVTRTDTGELLGSVSFDALDRARRRATAAYWLAAEARGHGFATAALAALTEWGCAELALQSVGVAVDADNDAGQRVALRAGFVAVDSSDATSRCFRRHVAR